MRKTEANYFAVAEIRLGSQTTVDPTTPVRVMGYDFTVYKRQLDEYTYRKKELRHFLKKAEELPLS